MKFIKIILILFLLALTKLVWAQQAYPASDAENSSTIPPHFSIQDGIENLNTKQNIESNQKSTIAIDMNYDGVVTGDTIDKGQDAILLLHLGGVSGKMPPQTEPDLKDLTYLPDYAALVKLDDDKNGRIDAHDSAYHYLYLLVKSNKNTYQIVSINKAGIRALFLPEDYLQSVKDEGWDVSNIQNSVLMSDGSRRALKQVLVRERILGK